MTGVTPRCLGHPSSVFCLLFDKSGNYVFSGADEIWGTYSGQLYFTFRGASAEISNMAVSDDNILLIASSTDKIIRVWCLLTAVYCIEGRDGPIKVLEQEAHTERVDSIQWSSSP